MDVSFDAFDWVVISAHNLFFYVAKTLAPIHLGVFYPLPNDGQPWLPLHFYVYAVLGIALVGLCVVERPAGRAGSSSAPPSTSSPCCPSAIQAAFFRDLPLLAADRYFYQPSIRPLPARRTRVLQRLAPARRGAARGPAPRSRSRGFAVGGGPLAAGAPAGARSSTTSSRSTSRRSATTHRMRSTTGSRSRTPTPTARVRRSARSNSPRAHPTRSSSCASSTTRCGISDLYRRKGDYGKAAEFLARAIDAAPNAIEPASPKTPLAYRYLAWLYEQAGDSAQAAAARQLAEQCAGRSQTATSRRYWFAMAPDVALTFLERRVAEAPDDAVAWYYLGQGYRLGHQDERAEACLRRAAALGFRP